MHWLEQYIEDIKNDFITNPNRPVEERCDFLDFVYKQILEDFLDRFIAQRVSAR